MVEQGRDIVALGRSLGAHWTQFCHVTSLEPISAHSRRNHLLAPPSAKSQPLRFESALALHLIFLGNYLLRISIISNDTYQWHGTQIWYFKPSSVNKFVNENMQYYYYLVVYYRYLKRFYIQIDMSLYCFEATLCNLCAL